MVVLHKVSYDAAARIRKLKSSKDWTSKAPLLQIGIMILNSLPDSKQCALSFEVGKAYNIVGEIGNGYIVRIELEVPESTEDEVQETFKQYLVLKSRFGVVETVNS